VKTCRGNKHLAHVRGRCDEEAWETIDR